MGDLKNFYDEVSTEVARKVFCENLPVAKGHLLNSWKKCFDAVREMHKDLPNEEASKIAVAAVQKIRMFDIEQSERKSPCPLP